MKIAIQATKHDSLLKNAFHLHRQGKIAEAMQAYLNILKVRPNDPNLNFLFGIASIEIKNYELAIELIKNAIQLDKSRSDFYANLGLAMGQSGYIPAAKLVLQKALILRPDQGLTYFNLGTITEHLGGKSIALKLLRTALYLEPNHSPSWLEFGKIARSLKNYHLALQAFSTSVQLNTLDPGTWFNLALGLADLGSDYKAKDAFKRCILLRPHHGEAIANLGNLLRNQKQRHDALVVFKAGIRFDPLIARIWSGLSAIQFDEDKMERAFSSASRACLLNPSLVDGWANIAQVEHIRSATSNAVVLGKRAYYVEPENGPVQFNLGTYLLGDGQLSAGWNAYEARFNQGFKTFNNEFGLPCWTEGKPPGRRLIVFAEQGLGDELLFATCLPDLNQMLTQGVLETLLFECDARLKEVFHRSFPLIDFFDRLKQKDSKMSISNYYPLVEDSKIDCYIYAGSLPKLLRPRLESFNRSILKLAPDVEKTQNWKSFFRTVTKNKVLGLTWRSMKNRDRGDIYYPPIESLGSVFKLPNISFVNLQYDNSEDELNRIEDIYGVNVIRPPNIDLMNDLDNLSALMSATDGIFSAYTAVLNLSGALNIPSFSPTYGYYWTTLKTKSLPWYPSVNLEMRYFGESWSKAVERISFRLLKHLNN